jgi:hypothetical protein
MGAWGAGIFSDHTAADVRNIYGELIRNGLDGVIATEKLLMQFAESLDDPDDGPPFWLGLAAVRYRLGRLEERVRDRAVRLIDDGTDLRRFSENPELARTRERITAKLRTHLIGPQRNRVRVRPEPQSACDWGDRRDRGD